jgi:dTDP-4-dehydrorhamnose reductase
MYSIAVLGSSGMIGHEIANRLQAESSFSVYRYQRSESVKDNSIIKFDVFNQNIKTISSEFSEYDFVINCTGVIKHLINPHDYSAIEKVKEVNSYFPKLLSDALKDSGTKIIEIGTDCVYSGSTGSYSEASDKNATDLYGESKKLGEVDAANVLRIRTSVVGLEIDRSKELLSWFLSKRNEEVDGFTNHYWNGITSYHLSLIIKTIILNNSFVSGTQHFFPADKVTKYALLEIFREAWSRDDLTVRPVEAPIRVDRTLTSNDHMSVANLWHKSGYLKIPTIKQLVEEYYLAQN